MKYLARLFIIPAELLLIIATLIDRREVQKVLDVWSGKTN